MQWNEIRQFVNRMEYCSVATVKEGIPLLKPVGSIYLEANEGCGYYFELFVKPIQPEEHFSIMAVDLSKLFWLKSLFKGQFQYFPSIRLAAIAGEKRPATEQEIKRFYRKVGPLIHTKGGQALWGKIPFVREIKIEGVYPVNLGKTTRHLKDKILWGNRE